ITRRPLPGRPPYRPPARPPYRPPVRPVPPRPVPPRTLPPRPIPPAYPPRPVPPPAYPQPAPTTIQDIYVGYELFNQRYDLTAAIDYWNGFRVTAIEVEAARAD